ncbi:MAG: response regulator [Candidatus Omnitrophota bacterium]
MEHSTVAIIDDESKVVYTIAEYLRDRGFIVKGFLCPKDFYIYLKKETPDLILLDLIFKGGNISGYDVCRQMQSKEGLLEIPLIVISGEDNEDNKMYCLSLGADDYITKPISLKDLEYKIKRAMKRRKMLYEESEIRKMKELKYRIERAAEEQRIINEKKRIEREENESKNKKGFSTIDGNGIDSFRKRSGLISSKQGKKNANTSTT